MVLLFCCFNRGNEVNISSVNTPIVESNDTENNTQYAQVSTTIEAPSIAFHFQSLSNC